MRPPPKALSAALLSVALAASTACSAAEQLISSGPPAPAADAGSPIDLHGVCPDIVTVATSWWPESTAGGLYHLLGAGTRIDKARKRITGPLVIDGKATGVQLQIRVGGPGANYAQAPQLLYTQPDLMLGQAATEEQIGASAEQPTTAVFAPMDQDPVVLIYDPKQYRDFHTIRDIGQTDVPVVVIRGPNSDYLTGTGILRPGQMDYSYDGTPVRFVAERGRIIVGGFSTNEPYVYEHLPTWRKPVDYLYITNAGYPNYRNAIVIRSRDKTRYADCLKQLVPILQRGQAQFIANPARALELIVQTVEAYQPGYPYTMDQALYGVRVMRDDALVVDAASAGYLGAFEESRLRKMLDLLVPIYESQKVAVKAGLRPWDLATNEFLDPTVHVQEGGR